MSSPSFPSLTFLLTSKPKVNLSSWKLALTLSPTQGPTISRITSAIQQNFPLIFIHLKIFQRFFILFPEINSIPKSMITATSGPSVSFYYTLSPPGFLYQSRPPWLWTYSVAAYPEIPPFGPPSSPTWRIFQPYFKTTINTTFLSSRPLFF